MLMYLPALGSRGGRAMVNSYLTKNLPPVVVGFLFGWWMRLMLPGPLLDSIRGITITTSLCLRNKHDCVDAVLLTVP